MTNTTHLGKDSLITYCGRKLGESSSTVSLEEFNNANKACKACQQRYKNAQKTRLLAINNKRRKTQWDA